MNCAEFVTVLSVGVKLVDTPNFSQRGGVSLQIRILKFKDVTAIKDSAGLSWPCSLGQCLRASEKMLRVVPNKSALAKLLDSAVGPTPPSSPPQ